MMVRVVLTGGPCAGKTSVMALLKQRLADRAVFVEEAATQLFAAGRPLPSPDWTDTDWLELQRAVTAQQLALEMLAENQALAGGRWLSISDRAPYDNTGYPMGDVAVTEQIARDPEFGHHRYHAVIHLESLATAQPERYGCMGNATRYESLAEAQALEMRAREAWAGHPNWVFLPGTKSVAELAEAALGYIEAAVAAA